jgi:hypothetical protein
MAWSISISDEGWEEIRTQLSKWSREKLINAISDDRYSKANKAFGDQIAIIVASLRMHEIHEYNQEHLVDIAFSLIEENNTCDNGGYSYWVDIDGYHRVELPEPKDNDNDIS